MTNLLGKWYNELGSVMDITEVKGNFIKGKYHTAVGAPANEYDLLGQALTDDTDNQAIGWVVVWPPSPGISGSVTAWSGQLQTINGIQYIVTTWLLTTETDPKSDWQSTLVGKDYFIRTMIAPDQIEANKQRGVTPSHPVKQ
jgi:Avidin family